MKIMTLAIASCMTAAIMAGAAQAKDKISISKLRQAVSNPQTVLDILEVCAKRPDCVVVPAHNGGSGDLNSVEALKQHQMGIARLIDKLENCEGPNCVTPTPKSRIYRSYKRQTF